MRRKNKLLGERQHIPETANWVPVQEGQVFEMGLYSNSYLEGYIEFYGRDGRLISSHGTQSGAENCKVPIGAVQARLTYTPR